MVSPSTAEPAIADIKSTERTVKHEFASFILIGALNTALYFILYNVFRLTMVSQVANIVAVTASVSFSFWANRRFTFQYAGSHRRTQFVQFAVVFLITLAVSSLALAALSSFRTAPTIFEENLTLIGSSGVLVVVRFYLMKRFVFNG